MPIWIAIINHPRIIKLNIVRECCTQTGTVYTRILAECKTQNKKDGIVGSAYTRITITIKINNKIQNLYTNLKGSVICEAANTRVYTVSMYEEGRWDGRGDAR